MRKISYILGCLGILLGLCACGVVKSSQVTATFYVQKDSFIAKTYSENAKLTKEDFPTEVRDGYVPDKWYLNDTFTSPVFLPYTITTDTNFYLKWIEEKPSTEETVTIQLVIDEKMTEKKIEKGTIFEKPQNPTKTGYTFKGWSITKDTYQEFNFSNKIEDNTTLYAFFDINQYSVAFYSNHTLYQLETVSYNQLVNQPQKPTLPGKIFKGWSLNEDSLQAFDFDTPIQKDLNLYAIFDNNDLTVEFYVNNSLYETKTITYDQAIAKPQDPVVSGFTLEGWYLEPTFKTKYNFNTPVKENLKLYANMIDETIPMVTVTYHIDNQITTRQIEKGSVLAKPQDPTKNGFTFKGWSTSSSSYTSYSFTEPVNAALELYAYFEINQYTIQFSVQNNIIETQKINYLETAKIPSSPNITGYLFEGWFTDQTFKNEFDFNTKITSSMTLYAKLTPIEEYTVTFILQDKTYQTQSIQANQTATKPTNPTITGYSFEGWFVDNEFTKEFDFNTKITSSINLYGKLTPIQKHVVTYLVNQESYHVEEVIHNGLTQKPVDPVSTDSKLSFVGWYLGADLFDFNTPITENITLTAHFEEVQIKITSITSSPEAIAIEIEKTTTAELNQYHIFYKASSDNDYTEVDRELIRENTSTVRCDIVGLKAGEYAVKVTVSNMTAQKTITVEAHDRSGYAHFNNSTGIGAYNNDGTLKSNAIVVYVTNENKNTVTVTANGKTYTGLVQILQNQSKIKSPLDIRIIGKITTNQWKAKSDEPRLTDNSNGSSTFFNNELETTYGENLAGLTIQYMDKKTKKSYKYQSTATGLSSSSTGVTSSKTTTYKGSEYPSLYGKTVYDDDSYFNMLDIELASYITLEGIGSDAEFFQWGLTWKKCNSIEVRNITFTDYTEDACSFEAGSNSDVDLYKNYWIHHNTFNRGKNNWDISGERDKYAGDGGIDLKNIGNVTLSYNKFNNCKKTGLVGGADDVKQKNITFHHNYYYKVESRLPLGRQANMHFYNNYYKDCSTCQDIRANAFVLSEQNYFDNCQYPQKVTTTDNYKGTIIKSVGDVYINCKNKSQATAANRTDTFSTGACQPDDTTKISYNNFDINSDLFYYDSVNQKSDVTVLHTPNEAKDDCIANAGVLKGNFTGNPGETPDPIIPDEPIETPDPIVPTENTTIITLDAFETSEITTATTVNSITILPKSGKTAKVTAKKQTIGGIEIQKFISFGGGGSFTELAIKFTTAKKANITVYYGSTSADRYVALFTSSNKTISTTPTTTDGAIKSFTFEQQEAGTYSVASSGSSINIYMIVLEYVE